MLPSNPSPFEDSTLRSDDSPFSNRVASSSGTPARPSSSPRGRNSQNLGQRFFILGLFLVSGIAGIGIWFGSSGHQSGASHYNAGLKLEKAGDRQGAIVEFSKSLDNEKNIQYRVDAYIHRGVLYRRIKQRDKAFSDFSSAIALDATRDAPYYDLGLIYEDRGNYSEALKNFDKSAQLNPKDNDVYSERAWVYLHLKKTDLALEQAKQLMARGDKLKPWARDDLTDALTDQVSAKIKTNDYPGALKGVNDLILLAPTLADLYRRRAAIYVLLGDALHARSDVNKCRELGGDVHKVEPLVKGLENG